MSWFSNRRGFIAGFVAASLLFGGLAGAADIIQKDIKVSYLPLKYVFDGDEKLPPADQQGFTFNGRTFVPLRFAAESLGKSVGYDAATYTINIGRKPSPATDIWTGFKLDGPATIKTQFFATGAQDLRGIEQKDSMLLTSMGLKPASLPAPVEATFFTRDFQLDKRYASLSATLFTPVHYFGHPESRRIGYVMVMNEVNAVIFRSEDVTTERLSVPIKLDLSTVNKIRVFFALYHNEGLVQGDMLATQMGISDLKLTLK